MPTKPPNSKDGVSDWLTGISLKVLEGFRSLVERTGREGKGLPGDFLGLQIRKKTWRAGRSEKPWREGQPIDSSLSLDLSGHYLNF